MSNGYKVINKSGLHVLLHFVGVVIKGTYC